MTNLLTNANIKDRSDHRITEHSTYYCIVLLIAYMVFYFYYNLLVPTADGELNIVALLSTAIMDLIVFFIILSENSPIPKRIALLVIMYLLMNIISYLINRSAFHRMLTLFLFLSVTYLCVTHPLSKREIGKVFLWLCIAVICILLNTSTDGERPDKFNPNGGGFLATIVYCVSLVFLSANKKEKQSKRLLYLFICIIAFGLQFVYGSRTSLLGLLLFTLATIVFRAPKKTFKSKVVAIVIVFLAIFGIIIAYVYSEVLYFALGIKQIEIFGKNLFTGREWIWHYAFESIRQNLFFGVGGHLNEAYAEGDARMMAIHNQPMGVLAEGGLFVFVFFYLALASIVSLPYKKNPDTRVNRLPAIFMGVIIVMSYFDAYFIALYNSLPILIAFAVILGISVKTKDQQCKKTLK